MKKLESLKEFETSTEELSFIVGGDNGDGPTQAKGTTHGITYSQDYTCAGITTYSSDEKKMGCDTL